MIHFFKFFLRIYNQTFSKDKVFVKRLKGLLGFTPSNIGIFKLAFYHKSTTSEKLYAVQSNERLEYLGDAILATIVAEYLFKKYPNSDEGFLTKMRSKIVKRQSLNTIADKMGLDVFLNQYNNTRLSKSMLGNALEALVGAVYLERGYGGTKKFVVGKILLGYLDIKELENFDDNYKSQLLEWCQKNGKVVSYKMVSKYKFEKRDRFKVAVLIDDKKVAEADDFNKKSAEQTASEKAMKILGILVAPTLEESNSAKKKSGVFGLNRSKKSNRKKDYNKKQDNRPDKKGNLKSRSDKPRTDRDRKGIEEHKNQRNNRPNRKEAPKAERKHVPKRESKNNKPTTSKDKNIEGAPRNNNRKPQQRTNDRPKETSQNRKPERKNNPEPQNKGRSNRVKESEDWEDIQIPNIKLDVPMRAAAKKPVAKSKPQPKKNNTPPEGGNKNQKSGNRRNFRNRPARNSNEENPNNPPPKKELTD